MSRRHKYVYKKMGPSGSYIYYYPEDLKNLPKDELNSISRSADSRRYASRINSLNNAIRDNKIGSPNYELQNNLKWRSEKAVTAGKNFLNGVGKGLLDNKVEKAVSQYKKHSREVRQTIDQVMDYAIPKVHSYGRGNSRRKYVSFAGKTYS